MKNNISDFLLHCRPTKLGPADPYTKLVWVDTYMIGCGYTGRIRFEGWHNKYYLCLYGPGGNIPWGNSRVYQIGLPCSACPASTTRDDGLCA